MQIRRIQPGDHDEWLRMRGALWLDTLQETLDAEIADVVADSYSQVVFFAARPVNPTPEPGSRATKRSPENQLV